MNLTITAIHLNSIIRLRFIMETDCVFCEIGLHFKIKGALKVALPALYSRYRDSPLYKQQRYNRLSTLSNGTAADNVANC